MRCPACQKDEVTHTVTESGGFSTLLAPSPGYWDANDSYVHPHDPNTHTTNYTCSNGHTWTVQE